MAYSKALNEATKRWVKANREKITFTTEKGFNNRNGNVEAGIHHRNTEKGNGGTKMTLLELQNILGDWFHL